MSTPRLPHTWHTIIVAGLLLLMAVQMFVGAKADSVTADEPIHLLSGYATLTEQHLLFDPEHPFLLKTWAALPLLWLQPEMPEQAVDLPDEFRDIDHNSYYAANQWGWQLLFERADDPYTVVLAARLMMIVVTLGLGLVIYAWARQLFGPLSLFILAMFSFDPTIIAHGHYINTDIGASLFFISTLAAYWNFLHKRSYTWLTLTGVSLGLGMLTKFSLGMLAIILPLLGLLWIWNHRNAPGQEFTLPLFSKLDSWCGWTRWQLDSIKHGLSIVIIGCIALAIIWIGYGGLMLLNPEDNPSQRPSVSQPAATVLTVLPPTYVKGLANVVAPNRQGYLLGQCFEGSRLDYFPLLSIFKTPLPSLFFVGLSFGLIGYALLKYRRLPRPKSVVAFIALPALVYLIISGITGINIGIRHVLPIYILLLIAMGYSLQWLWRLDWRPKQLYGGKLVVALLVGCVAVSSFMAWPNYLPYYNILAQEPRSVPFIADDSNMDWGQGTKLLADYVAEHAIESIAFDNFISRAEADYLEIPYTEADANNHDYTGYLAISRSTINKLGSGVLNILSRGK